MTYNLINSNNELSGSVVVEDNLAEQEQEQQLIDRTPPGFAVVKEPVPEGVTAPKWDGSAWYENLDQLKLNKKSEIKSAFQVAIETGSMLSTVLGVWVNARPLDKQNAADLKQYMEANGTLTDSYRVYDNSFVTVTPADLGALVNELIAHGKSLYEKKWVLEAIVDSSTTPEEINEVNW